MSNFSVADFILRFLGFPFIFKTINSFICSLTSSELDAADEEFMNIEELALANQLPAPQNLDHARETLKSTHKRLKRLANDRIAQKFVVKAGDRSATWKLLKDLRRSSLSTPIPCSRLVDHFSSTYFNHSEPMLFAFNQRFPRKIGPLPQSLAHLE